MKLNRILLAFLIPLVCGLVLSSRSDLRVHTFNHEQILGTSLELKVVARSPERPRTPRRPPSPRSTGRRRF